MCSKSANMDYVEPHGGSNGQGDASDPENPRELELFKVDEVPMGATRAGEKDSLDWGLALDFMR